MVIFCLDIVIFLSNACRKTESVERRMVMRPNWLHSAAISNDFQQIEAKARIKSYELDINLNDRLQ